jgi:SprT protein
LKVSPHTILQKHLPEKSFDYCLDLFSRYPFKLKIKKARITKAGDFCAHHGHAPIITINHDLNPFLFLTTFIHEFSHHAVYLIYGNKPQAHGSEWKLAFKTFMQPVMEMKIFPGDLQVALTEHLKDPMASSFSDTALTQIFRRYDPGNSDRLLLSQIKEGEIFLLRTKQFRKGKLRRTRVLCDEVRTGRKYLVPVDAEVKPVL